METAKENEDSPFCGMCSTKHYHWSSAEERMTAICYSENNVYHCQTCGVEEPALQDLKLTQRVLLADEIILGIWGHGRRNGILTQIILNLSASRKESTVISKQH